MARIQNHHLDGLLRGAVGSLAGLAAMSLFFKATSSLSARRDTQAEEGRPDPVERRDELNDISIVGQQSREDESAPATVGRLAYRTVTHDDPDEETKRKLGHAVHWGYGVLLGGAYGALRADVDSPDLMGGLGYGTAAWAIGDELMVPLLGLAGGPTTHPLSDHLTALGAHLAYGAATSTATQALKRFM